MKIGIFDSGIGGLTVLHQAMITLPQEEYLYYADTDHVPYGIRPKEEILEFVDNALRFMLGKGVKAVIIACNTATSAAIKTLRSRYSLPILGMEPAVKPAVAREEEGKRVMVAATPLTLREEKLRNLLHQVDKHHTVDLLPLPELVRFAEREEFTSQAVLIHSCVGHPQLQELFYQFACEYPLILCAGALRVLFIGGSIVAYIL